MVKKPDTNLSEFLSNLPVAMAARAKRAMKLRIFLPREKDVKYIMIWLCAFKSRITSVCS